MADQTRPQAGEFDERRVGRLLVRIDRSLCVGFGDCITAAPPAFVLGADDVVVFAEPEAVEPEQLVRACASCPVDALTVWDEMGIQLAP
jgi:ferredoxin